jgi:uncharacterized tellurite resistance protein B-like protein
MNYTAIIARLYFMLIYADGNVNEKEIALAKQMILAEGLKADEFFLQMESLKSIDSARLFSDAISALKKLDQKQQIRLVAWLCVLANADGFMERTEWQFIYKIYHKELGLPLNEIFAVQKDLNKTIWESVVTTI